MGSFIQQHWKPDPTAFGPRRSRIGGTYRAFIPNELTDRPLKLDARISADVSDAEGAIRELNQAHDEVSGPHRLEVLARLLLRAEAVGSSRIEGLVISPRKLAMADFDPKLDPSGRALEVVGNIRALHTALELARQPGPVNVGTLCEIHAMLLEGTSGEHFAGEIRREQNWIGGHTPLDAEYVPPPPGEVPRLLEDLCAYLSNDEHSPLVQAAIAHAQFETIHPFADGNGRTGRALIQFVLRRRGLCPRIVPPISLVLATWSQRYVDALMGTRTESPVGSQEDEEGWASWIELVAQSARVASTRAQVYEGRIDELVSDWKRKVTTCFGKIRSDAALWSVLELLPAAPLVTSKSAVELTGRSAKAVDLALNQRVDAGVLKQIGGRLRYRLFEAKGVFNLVTETERALATPSWDTRVQAPERLVPARPQRD